MFNITVQIPLNISCTFLITDLLIEGAIPKFVFLFYPNTYNWCNFMYKYSVIFLSKNLPKEN